MPVSSAIVEIEAGAAGEAVLCSLSSMDTVTVYGIKENKIVIVIDAKTIGGIEESTKRIESIEGVTGVFSVYSSIDE